MVMVPIAVGQLLRQYIWDKTETIRPFIRIVPQFIILMFVYTGFASGAAQLQKDSDIVLRFLTACALLHVILLGLNFAISGALGFKWPERTAIILSGSQKTLPNGIYIWSNFFSMNPYGAVPLVLYHLFQLLVDTLLVPKFENKNPVSEGSTPKSVAINCHGDVRD